MNWWCRRTGHAQAGLVFIATPPEGNLNITADVDLQQQRRADLQSLIAELAATSRPTGSESDAEGRLRADDQGGPLAGCHLRRCDTHEAH
jgi:hypothetical protein